MSPARNVNVSFFFSFCKSKSVARYQVLQGSSLQLLQSLMKVHPGKN